jgi:hypothetical protein
MTTGGEATLMTARERRQVDLTLETTREQLEDEVEHFLNHISYDDLAIHETIALHVLLRPAYERLMARQAPPAPVVKLRAVGGGK